MDDGRRGSPKCPVSEPFEDTVLKFPVPVLKQAIYSQFRSKNTLFRFAGNSLKNICDFSSLRRPVSPDSSRIHEFSLYFPCITGKSMPRPVRSRLATPPLSLCIYRCFHRSRDSAVVSAACGHERPNVWNRDGNLLGFRRNFETRLCWGVCGSRRLV